MIFNPHKIKYRTKKEWDGRVVAVCSCGEYETPRPMSPARAKGYSDKHLEGMERRFAFPWYAVLVDVGLRRVFGQDAVQLLTSTTGQCSSSVENVNQVIALNMTREEARSLGERLLKLADE